MFGIPVPEGMPATAAKLAINLGVQAICNDFSGEVVDVDLENLIVTIEFDSRDDAEEAAANFPPNDRLEDVPGHPGMVRLSAKSLWVDEGDAAEAMWAMPST